MAPGFPKPNPYCPRLCWIRGRAEEDAEPVLYSLLFLGPRLDELLTMWMNWAYIGAYPNPYLEDLPNSNNLPSSMDSPFGNDGQPATFEWSPGKFLEIPRGKRFAFMSPPQVGADVRQMADLFRGLIDIAGIPSILRGTSLSGDSGYLASQMISAATMMYKRLGAALERQISSAAELMFYIVDTQFKQTVYVRGQGDDGSAWLGLRANGETTDYIANVNDLGPVSISLRPVLPTMDQANAMIARQLTDGPKPLDSLRHARETWLGYEDPDKIADEIAVEEALNTEPLRSMVIDDALRMAGLGQPPTPPTGLVGPDGLPIASGMMGGMPPPIPGDLSGGIPTIPGIGAMPLPGGRPAGMAPGLPPNPVQGL
jgi:hypothetical protein